MTGSRNTVPTGFPSQLLSGYGNFRSNRLRFERQRYEDLAQTGQKPEVLIIACCDSRSGPEMIFDASPGELFVVRNVANLVPPYNPNDSAYHGTSAALEFAVQALKVKHIVIMGHGRCGGIQAYIENQQLQQNQPLSPGDYIGKWMSLLDASFQDIELPDTSDDPDKKQWLQRQVEEFSIRRGLENVRSYPCVNILEGRQKIQLHGAWFDISSGELWILDEQTGQFVQPQ